MRVVRGEAGRRRRRDRVVEDIRWAVSAARQTTIVVRKGRVAQWGREVGGAVWAPPAAGGGGDQRWRCWSVERREKKGIQRKKKGKGRD
jgi:hypothetical protein